MQQGLRAPSPKQMAIGKWKEHRDEAEKEALRMSARLGWNAVAIVGLVVIVSVEWG